MGVPDYLKDNYHVQGKLSILEQHQINLRKHYLTTTSDNGLNPDELGLRFAMKELGANVAPLVALSNDDSNDNVREPLPHGNSRRKSCRCDPESSGLDSIEISLAKILELMEDNILKEQRKAEWSMLGALIDRILLIALIIAASTTTLYIYVLAPVFVPKQHIQDGDFIH